MSSLLEILGFSPNQSYSTMIKGGLEQRVIYNGIECIWGLREKGYAPSLIHPRPNIRLYTIENGEEVIYNQHKDFVMHRCIQKEKPEDIIKAMFDKNISFIYDETNN